MSKPVKKVAPKVVKKPTPKAPVKKVTTKATPKIAISPIKKPASKTQKVEKKIVPQNEIDTRKTPVEEQSTFEQLPPSITEGMKTPKPKKILPIAPDGDGDVS